MDWEGLLVLMMVKRVGYVMSNSIQLYLSLGVVSWIPPCDFSKYPVTFISCHFCTNFSRRGVIFAAEVQRSVLFCRRGEESIVVAAFSAH